MIYTCQTIVKGSKRLKPETETKVRGKTKEEIIEQFPDKRVTFPFDKNQMVVWAKDKKGNWQVESIWTKKLKV